MENYVGKRLDGRYEIQEIIGVGGMAVVYKAYDNIDDRTVAVKILKEEFGIEPNTEATIKAKTYIGEKNRLKSIEEELKDRPESK